MYLLKAAQISVIFLLDNLNRFHKIKYVADMQDFYHCTLTNDAFGDYVNLFKFKDLIIFYDFVLIVV